MSKRSHTSLALTTALLAFACGPAAAEAATVKLVHYDVSAEATLAHKHGYAFASNYESARTSVDLTSKVRTSLGRVTFRDGYMVNVTAAGPATAATTGTANGSYSNKVFAGTRTCTATGGARPSGQGSMESALLAPLGAEALNLRLADALEVDWTCTGDERVSAMPAYPLTDNPGLGSGPLDAQFEIPHEAVGYGKIVQNIAGPGGGFCAGAELPNTTSCEYGWTGQVTFTKTSETVVSDVQRPGGPATKPTDDDLSDLLAPLVPAKTARADARGSTLSLTASCPAGCAGTAALTVPGAKASAAKARKPVATMRFRVKAGKPRLVKLRVPKKAARALRRARRGKLAVTLKPARGRAVKRTLTVKVGRR